MIRVIKKDFSKRLFYFFLTFSFLFLVPSAAFSSDRVTFTNKTGVKINVRTMFFKINKTCEYIVEGRNFPLFPKESDDLSPISENEIICFCYSETWNSPCRDVELCVAYPGDTIDLDKSHNCYEKPN